MKQRIIPILSIVTGLAAFLLTLQYLAAKERELIRIKQELYSGARQIWVVGASGDLPGGSVIQKKDVGRIQVLEKDVSDRVIRLEDAAQILGKKTLLPLAARKPILWSDIEGGAVGSRGLSRTIQPGLRAISLAVGGAQAVSSMVAPGDRVDVIGTFTLPSKTIAGELETVTLTVLQDVSVLATGQQLADQFIERSRSPAMSGYSTVTLEVTPKEVELLVFAQQNKGRLTLSLRNRSDVSFEKELPSIDFKQLESTLPELNQHRQRNIRKNRTP
ncbi:MAG: Flp pilus assembly protein CpaB [Lentisphaerae bacterium RIFOXYB12_FULL_60_10]|nr:MAG: Flp pilus assembly protein CpaB [Lentisphaerae bacterium RIFOXYB12_FULL_60_10]